MGYGPGVATSLLALLFLAGGLTSSSAQNGITLPGVQASSLDSGSSMNASPATGSTGSQTQAATPSPTPAVSGSKDIAGASPEGSPSVSLSFSRNPDSDSSLSPMPGSTTYSTDGTVSTGAAIPSTTTSSENGPSLPDTSSPSSSSAIPSTTTSSEDGKSSNGGDSTDVSHSSNSGADHSSSSSSSSSNGDGIQSTMSTTTGGSNNSGSSSSSTGCLQNPTLSNCAAYTYQKSEAANDLHNICSEKKGLAGCAVFRACQTKPKSSVGKQPDTCDEFTLLSTICNNDGKMYMKVSSCTSALHSGMAKGLASLDRTISQGVECLGRQRMLHGVSNKFLAVWNHRTDQ